MNDINGAFFIYFDKFDEAADKATHHLVESLNYKDNPLAFLQHKILEDKFNTISDEYLILTLEAWMISEINENDDELKKFCKEFIKKLKNNIKERREKWNHLKMMV